MAVDATPLRVRDRVRRFRDLLTHEVREAVFLGLGYIPVDLDQAVSDGVAAERGHGRSQRRQRRHLTLAEHQHAAGVGDQRCDVGSDELLLLAEPDHQGRVEPGAHQQFRVVGREEHQRERPLEPPQRLAHGTHQVPPVVVLDQVRDDLGVGVRLEPVPGGGQLRLELREVLDDPVVDHRDASAAVDMRVRVDERRPAVRRPPRVPDTEMAGRHPGAYLGDQLLDAGLRLGDGGGGAPPVEHRNARRVVPPVLQSLQALEQDRGGLSLTEVTDDPAHGASLAALL